MIVGALAGLLLGWLAWLAAARYRRASVPAGGAALPLAAMTLWGGWAGAQAASPAVALSALVVSALLLCIALVDLKTRRIPDALTLALLAWAGVQGLGLGRPGWAAAGLGLAAAGALFLLLYLLGRGALGLGDVKLAAALGALLGFPAVLAGLLAGVLLGGLAAAGLLLTGRAGRRDSFAYGPCLALGAWLIYTRLLGLWPQ